MIRLPSARHAPPHLLAVALFIALQCAPLPGQSSEAARAATLDVLSAHYNRITERIKFTLVNNSQKAAISYYVAFGVMGEKQVLWESGAGEDLSDSILTSQCRNAGANAPEGDDSWEGAIEPGGVYVHSESANLPKNQLRGVDPPVQAAVAGVIWSDGSVETPTITGATGWVSAAINRWFDQQKEDAQESAKVVAILNAHPEDADIRHRIGEATRSLQSLMDEYRRAAQAQASGKTRHVDGSYLVSRVLINLNNFVALRRPEVPFNVYKTVFECQSKRRSAMLQAMPLARPEP